MAVAFAVVGLAFLLAPSGVVAAFDSLSLRAGLAPAGPAAGFYLVLAVAYMYLVTLLAMMPPPENRVGCSQRRAAACRRPLCWLPR
jgi:hypothetical protein